MTELWYDSFFGNDYARFDEHPHTSEEVDFLRDVLPEKGTLLDLACGMGRHSVPLSESGYDVIGLDRSRVLLRVANDASSSVSWVRGDTRAVPIADESVDGVVNMFSSLGYFEDESENYRVLAEAARVLRPGGRLVIETVNVAFLIQHAPPQTWFTSENLTVLESREYDPVTCRSEVDVVVIEGGETRNYSHSIRLYGAAELAMLLASVGIETLDVFGDFDGEELTVDTPHMILVGERV
jgi:ubiquinone/menaquinone biosynthesis C-methylase UbiE